MLSDFNLMYELVPRIERQCDKTFLALNIWLRYVQHPPQYIVPSLLRDVLHIKYAPLDTVQSHPLFHE